MLFSENSIIGVILQYISNYTFCQISWQPFYDFWSGEETAS